MSLQSSLDALLGDAAARRTVPGVIAMVTDRQRNLYEGAFGQRVLGADGAMTTDTVGWIASMTKAITGAACMQLVEQGRLSLDSPAKAVVARLGECQVLTGFDAAGQPQMRAPKRDITLRHLLTHTAGFGYEFWNAETGRYQAATGTPGIISCSRAAMMQPLVFDPGERWLYGINIDWAARMVEAVSGLTIGQYLQQNVLGPLGMTETGFRIRDDQRARLAKIHHRGDDGSLVAGELEIEQNPEHEMGGGGLYGTVGDYMRFIRMMLNGGRADDGTPVLKPETVALMSRNAMGDLRVTNLPTQAPPLTLDAEFFPGVEKTWGLTFQINEAPAPTGLPAGSLMWAGLANSYYWIDPTTGIGGAYLTQILPFADSQSLPLFYAMQTATYREITR
jgi:methyl acetate hydrolase